MTIKAEVTAGESIENAFREAIRIAKILNCWIEFDFNGVTCMANSKGDIDKGANEYYRIINNNTKSYIAFS